MLTEGLLENTELCDIVNRAVTMVVRRKKARAAQDESRRGHKETAEAEHLHWPKYRGSSMFPYSDHPTVTMSACVSRWLCLDKHSPGVSSSTHPRGELLVDSGQ